MKKYKCPKCSHEYFVSIGRPRSVDYEQVVKLRKPGMIMQKIAIKLNCSLGAVYRGCKDAGLCEIK